MDRQTQLYFRQYLLSYAMRRMFRHFHTTVVKLQHKNIISTVSDDGFTKKAETCHTFWTITILSVKYNFG
jgi:hypothetical protein